MHGTSYIHRSPPMHVMFGLPTRLFAIYNNYIIINHLIYNYIYKNGKNVVIKLSIVKKHWNKVELFVA